MSSMRKSVVSMLLAALGLCASASPGVAQTYTLTDLRNTARKHGFRKPTRSAIRERRRGWLRPTPLALLR